VKALALAIVLAGAAVAVADPPKPSEVWLHGKAGKLQAWLWRPSGAGPFPAVVYNHGSEQQPMAGTDSAVGPFFVAHGYAVLFPYRRGSGKSEGRHWSEGTAVLPPDRGEQITIDHLVQENDDVVTALDWLRAQPWVAHDNLAVAGCSFGGIETLLTAERPVTGLRAALDFAGASMSWDDSPRLRERLLAAVEHARVPIFFLQAENDFNTAPSKILSAAMRAKKLPYRMRIFDSAGETPMAGHAGFCMQRWDLWGDAVLDFLGRPR
jgi:carboxymethylenebutenolidase